MSNLLALQNSDNELGLGTTHIGLGTIGPSVLPFIVNDTNKILMDFNTSNNSINLGTISSGVWNGSIIQPEYGGLGNVGIGTANYILAVNNDRTGFKWVNNDISSETNIATEVTSDIDIGSTGVNLTINASKLNLNIGDTVPYEGQVLKYVKSTNSLTWTDSSFTHIDKLWTLMKTLHPGYVLFLKSIKILDESGATLENMSPTFNPTITNYSINVGQNTYVSIIPTDFSYPTGTSTTITQIDNNPIKNPNNYIINNQNQNIFSITNSYTENSQTFSKTYSLNITRDTSTDNNLKNCIITKEVNSINGNVIVNESIEASRTTYTVDVDENIKNIKLVAEVNRKINQLSIGNTNLTLNTDSIIGIGTAYIGIGTNFKHNSITDNTDLNIDSGRIVDVDLKITSESGSDNTYKFQISNPSRNNAELASITVNNQIISTPSPQPAIIQTTINPPGTITINLPIKKHVNQVLELVDVTNNNNAVDLDSSWNADPPQNLVKLIPTYIIPGNTVLKHIFDIKNTSPNGLVSNTYRIEATTNRSDNTVPASITFNFYNSNSQISSHEKTFNTSDLANLTHTLYGSVNIDSILKITINRSGGQQATFLNSSLGTTEPDNIDIFTQPYSNTSATQDINLNTTYSNDTDIFHTIKIRITAENNTHADYEFIIKSFIYVRIRDRAYNNSTSLYLAPWGKPNNVHSSPFYYTFRQSGDNNGYYGTVNNQWWANTHHYSPDHLNNNIDPDYSDVTNITDIYSGYIFKIQKSSGNDHSYDLTNIIHEVTDNTIPYTNTKKEPLVTQNINFLSPGNLTIKLYNNDLFNLNTAHEANIKLINSSNVLFKGKPHPPNNNYGNVDWGLSSSTNDSWWLEHVVNYT